MVGEVEIFPISFICDINLKGNVVRSRQWQSTPILLPGKPHGQRSLVGYGPWGRKESDMTEQLPLIITVVLK